MKEIAPINLEKEKSKNEMFVNEQEILNYSPEDLSNYLEQLEASGKLEKFLEQASSSDTLLAQFSYWEKWLEEKQQKLIDELIQKKKKMYPGNKESLPLNLGRKLSSEDLELIFSNCGAIQLTFGCTKGCPFCGFDAVHRKKNKVESIPYPQLATLFEKYGKSIRRTKPLLYWASEPSDYAWQEGLEDRTYEDIHQLAIRYADYGPHITSRNLTNNWLKFMEKQADTYHGSAYVSTNNLSDKKFKNIPESLKIYKYYPDSPHDEDIGLSAKSTGYKQNKFRIGGIGCFDGVLLSPRGIYNIIQRNRVSREYPQAQVVVPIKEIAMREKIYTCKNIKEILTKSVVRYRSASREKVKNLNKFDILCKDDFIEVITDDHGGVNQIISSETRNRGFLHWDDIQ